MPSTTVLRGNCSGVILIGPTLTPVAVATITTAEQTFTVPGLQLSDFVIVNPAVAQTAGVGIVGARVSAVNTLAVTFDNPTAGSVTPVAGVYQIAIFRPENLPLPTSAV